MKNQNWFIVLSKLLRNFFYSQDHTVLSQSRTLSINVRLFSFFIFFILSACFAQAADSQDYIEKARALNLAQDPFWRSLLHFKGNRSQIIDESFFLSDRGKVDPAAELEATIKAYFTQEHKIERMWGDKNIVCIFPARYMWLNKKLNLPNYKIDSIICPGLSEWARLDQIESISLIYVSGYLGNPASSFGHVLLNLKIKDSEPLLGLFDTSISYGATVPANENMVLYILKGLFGGYSATFSDKFFYAHDQVYSSREFRDMWEYTLEFSDTEKVMLIYHLAELLTKRYTYYFLNANCAHRIAVLLDIFVKESVYNFDYPIYIPEELFHRLQAIDKQRRGRGENTLIKSIKYIPSARRYLFYETQRLSSDERHVYRMITNSPHSDITSQLESLDVEGRIDVLNSLLAYQYYKLMASDEEQADQRLKEYKDKILLERLRLPAMKEKPVIIPEVPSPKDIAPPSSFNAGFVFEDGRDLFTTLGYTVYRRESVGLTALEYNELVALNLNLGFLSDSQNFFIDSFDFLKIRDFKTFYIQEAKESPLSWRLRAGGDRYNTDKGSSYDYVMDGGMGLVKKVTNLGIYYGFVNLSSHSRDQQFRSGPSVGFMLGEEPLKLEFNYGLEFGLEYYGYIETIQTKFQYQINKQNAIQLAYEKNDRQRLTLNYIFYW